MFATVPSFAWGQDFRHPDGSPHWLLKRIKWEPDAGKSLQRGGAARALLSVTFATIIVKAFVAFALNASVLIVLTALTLFTSVGGLTPATLFNLEMKNSSSPCAIPVVSGWQQQ